ncbi:MAG: restriction endonuclease subunit R [Acidobacteria bacterium]|nr:MAG: restriction endonuclease subunit R [Acidobacteriota bacterium]
MDLRSVLAEVQRLLEENIRLRCLLQEHGIQIPSVPSTTGIPVTTSALPSAHIPVLKAEQRIALFRSLFHGRDDVYAVRWENTDGRYGYMPKADRDWKAYLRAKDEDRKKVDRQTRKFRPLTDEVVRGHLVGDHTIGIYPLLQDETCWFLAVDFDKKTWQKDVLAFLTVCCELNVPAALERSRSGNGGHVWIFFDRAIPATTARKLGCAILTRAMESRHQLGLDSYDRFFPNQDTMPKGGLGNLIALPLQKLPRADGNSVFVDTEFRPYDDQWTFLASVKRMPVSAAEAVVLEAQRNGDLIGVRIVSAEEEVQDPWTLPPTRKRADRPIPGPFPVQVQIVRANLLYIEKKDLPCAMLNRLLRLGAFQNPDFYKAQAMRLPTFNKPRVIACGEELADHIALPRGCLVEVIGLLKSHRIKPIVRDERFVGRPIEVEFSGRLRPLQQDAVDAFAQHDEGILCAPTAFGKTAVAAWLIASRKVNTLILVHRQQLLDQWNARLAMFLGLPAKSIGQIGGGTAKRSGCVDIAILQSAHDKEGVKDFVADYGQVIVDECHHLSAFTFEQVMRRVKAKYVVGLTATPERKDGRHPIIYMQCGQIRFKLSARSMTAATPFEHEVVPRLTDFSLPPEQTDKTIQEVYAALVDDRVRNELILHDLIQATADGRSPLLLTGRTDHLKYFDMELAGKVNNVFMLKGGMGKKQRRSIAEAIAAVPEGEPRVILATGSYIGEGFDDARLDTLFLAMPISWKGTLQQYVGRLHRLHDAKRVVRVYDYVDSNVPMLARMYARRLKGYALIGYTIRDTSYETSFLQQLERQAPKEPSINGEI